MPSCQHPYKFEPCIILKYSIDGAIIFTQNTFTQARTWVNKLRTLASPDIVIALAGNKADLEAQRMVNTKVRCLIISMGMVRGADGPTHGG